MKSIFALTVAGLLAAMGAGVPAHAGSFGNAPWCAVQNLGAGDVARIANFAASRNARHT